MNKKVQIAIIGTIVIVAIIVLLIANNLKNKKETITPEQRAEQVEEKTAIWMADSIEKGVTKKAEQYIEELKAQELITEEEQKQLKEDGTTQIGSKTITIEEVNLEKYVDIEENDGIIKLKSVNTEILKKYGITEAKVRIVYPDMETSKVVNLLDNDLGIEYKVNENEIYTFKIAPYNGQSTRDVRDITIMVKNNI